MSPIAPGRVSAFVLAAGSLARSAWCAGRAEWYPYSHETWSTGVENHDYICKEGTEQSPINFPSCVSPIARPPPSITWALQEVSLFNNGHTVQLDVDGNREGGPGSMSYQIANLEKTYTLVQCHFHYGSEHSIGGTQFPFEAHCVHTLDGSDSAQRYGVFGLFFEVGANESAFLRQFEDDLPTHYASFGVRRAGETAPLNVHGSPIGGDGEGRRLANWRNISDTLNGPIDFKLLYGGLDLTKYFNYEGSFTTPPCTEAVDFYIMIETASLSRAQHEKFKAAIGWNTAGGNFRPPQKVGARTIYGCTVTPAPVADLSWYPYQAKIWAADVGKDSHRVCASGSEQSPINFEGCAFPTDRTAVEMSWARGQPVALINNGHTIQLTTQSSAPGGMRANSVNYSLVQCHFHWGSEHTVAGRQFPFEAHCVHKKGGSEEAPHYGVFGLFFKLGTKAHPFLSAFEDHLIGWTEDEHRRRLQEDGAAAASSNVSFDLFGNPLDGSSKRKLGSGVSYPTSSWHGPLDFNRLYENNTLVHYWDYKGSFTTPPCTEAVDFYIMMEPAPIAEAQLVKFKNAIGWVTSGGNFRPPQNLGSRIVSGCAVVASTATMLQDAVSQSMPRNMNFMVSSAVSLEMRKVLSEEQGHHTWMLTALTAIGVLILGLLLAILFVIHRDSAGPAGASAVGSSSPKVQGPQLYGHMRD